MCGLRVIIRNDKFFHGSFFEMLPSTESLICIGFYLPDLSGYGTNDQQRKGFSTYQKNMSAVYLLFLPG
jgi:hypothetical protein